MVPITGIVEKKAAASAWTFVKGLFTRDRDQRKRIEALEGRVARTLSYAEGGRVGWVARTLRCAEGAPSSVFEGGSWVWVLSSRSPNSCEEVSSG
jgi:hypothetical protein